jgi:enamine deaminase RidA (YjgF/YER057c/UK114 family)
MEGYSTIRRTCDLGGPGNALSCHITKVARSGSEPIGSGVFVLRATITLTRKFGQAFKNLEKTLQRAGGTLKDIVLMTVAVSDGRYAQRFTDTRKEIYGKDFPASTLLTAASLAVTQIMVEITQ